MPLGTVSAASSARPASTVCSEAPRAGFGWSCRVEQVEFGPAGGAHLVLFGLGQGQERSSEYTGSPGYQQTHRYRFPHRFVS